MGTRGYLAYRYQGQYYRQYLKFDAYPSEYGTYLARLIPRRPAALEEWITQTANKLLSQESRERLFDWEETDICVDSDWTLGKGDIQWTYVVDLDNRVLTVNGVLHFKFDNLPPWRATGSKLAFVDYLQCPAGSTLPKIPAEYLASVAFWPEPKLDVEAVEKKYSALQPIVAPFSEWNAPTWDTLSVSQRLSARLIETLVYDYSDDLGLCYYPSIWFKIGVICWNVANAAATSHLLSPPLNTSPPKDMIYVFSLHHSKWAWIPAQHSATHRYLQHEGTMRRFCRFRGCLITSCPRLDDPAYMTHKIVDMARRLRKYDREQGVGIIMSGWHLVAVTINGSEVRHSPVLELHDGKKPKDGALLLMHLSSPTFTSSKAPRLTPPPSQKYDTHPILPDEVIRQIIHFTDFETYLRLPLVSRHFRSIYLAYPRIGDHILLGHMDTSPNSEPVFKIRSMNSTNSKFATLKRTKSSIPDPQEAVPILEYQCKSYYKKPVLQIGLAGMFQCHQTGTKSFDPAATEETKEINANGVALKPMPFAGVVNGTKYPTMRVQTLDGVWEMVEVDGVERGAEK